MQSSEETTPLLVDPPIDDESYRREARTFPSDEQKHLMLASYTVTITISRFFEIISTLFMATSYSSSLIPITMFSFTVLASSSLTQQLSYFLARLFKSRLRLLAISIFFQRLAMFLFAYLILHCHQRSGLVFDTLMVGSLAVCVVLLKASLHLYQAAIRRDWLYTLSNGKDSVRIIFEKSAHAISVILQLLLPVMTGLLVSSASIEDCARILEFTAVLATLVELSLIWKLHSTCYALYLPRSSLSLESFDNFSMVSEGHPMFGVLTTPSDIHVLSHTYSSRHSRPLMRIIKYVKRKPIPVTVTVGVILINFSLITIGPHMVWFLLKENMNPAVVGVFKLLQTLVTLHPAIPATRSFNIVAIGSIGSVFFLILHTLKILSVANIWVYLFAMSVVVTRAGIPTINMIGDHFVESYLADEEVHKVYKENAVWLRTQCELLVHVLTLIFPTANEFVYPISISAFGVILGRYLVLKMIKKYSRQDQV